MTRRILILILFLIPSLARAQGQQITVGPFSTAGLVYVCPVPSGGTPCPSPSSIFSNSALTSVLANPFSMPTQTIVTFYAAPGQYTVEMPASGTQLVVGGGGGGGSNTQNVITATFNANEVQVMDITTTNGQPTISSAGQAKWVQGDIGKTIVGFDFCEQQTNPATATQIIGTTSANPTILSVQDATHITLSVNASASKTNACVDYGTLDDTAASAIDTALTTTALCPKIQLPAGRIMLASGHWNAAVTACTNTPQNKSGSPGILPALTIAGQGAGATVLHLLPAFNFASCIGGSTALSCFGGQKFTQIRDLTITGDGISYASGGPGGSGVVGVELQCGSLLNVSAMFWGYSAPRANPMRGIESTCPTNISTDTISNYVEDGFGSQGLFGNGNFVASNITLADNCDIPLWMNTGLGIIGGGTNLIGQNACSGVGNAIIELASGNTPNLIAALTSFYSNSVSAHGIQIDGPGTATLLGNAGFQSLAATQTDIVLNNASAVLTLQNTKWQVGTSTLCGGSGGTVIDIGGNNYGGLTCSFTTYTFKHAEKGTCVFAASTTCTVTFTQPFGTTAVPGAVTITGYNPGAVTFTISTPTSTGFTITGSASNSLTVAWTAQL